ncbi:hypothetical protein [Paracoccus pacificus]|uniref:PEP-CTERM protein-sorting domain-containing protein n=1 Tax=Paracoccus pacificus TaxID=1463598 RepID=A0ABW4R4X5_9RHOB
MLYIIIFALGAAIGFWRARRAGGNGMDVAQYALAHGFAFGAVTLIAVIVYRMAV